jgi:hypothetical protein
MCLSNEQGDDALTKRDDNSGGEERAAGTDGGTPAPAPGPGNGGPTQPPTAGQGNGSNSNNGSNKKSRNKVRPKITKSFNPDGTFHDVTLSFGESFKVTANNTCAQVSYLSA